jgi:hypothetical protein
MNAKEFENAQRKAAEAGFAAGWKAGRQSVGNPNAPHRWRPAFAIWYLVPRFDSAARSDASGVRAPIR